MATNIEELPALSEAAPDRKVDRFGTEIVDYMRLYQDVHMTAAEIAAGIDYPARSVATKLTWMRGAGLVNNDYGRSKVWQLI